MSKICFDKSYIINFIIILIIIILYLYSNYINNYNYNNINTHNNTNIDQNTNNNKNNNDNDKIIYIKNNDCQNLPYNYINSIDRVYNPLRFPVKSYNPFNYGQCGDSLITNYNNNDPINNPYTINYRTRPYCDQIQQLGAISKVNGDQNDIYPLYGRQKINNRNQYEYYTIVNGVKLITKPKNNYQELDNNDTIKVNQLDGDFLVSVYNNETLF